MGRGTVGDGGKSRGGTCVCRTVRGGGEDGEGQGPRRRREGRARSGIGCEGIAHPSRRSAPNRRPSCRPQGTSWHRTMLIMSATFRRHVVRHDIYRQFPAICRHLPTQWSGRQKFQAILVSAARFSRASTYNTVHTVHASRSTTTTTINNTPAHIDNNNNIIYGRELANNNSIHSLLYAHSSRR